MHLRIPAAFFNAAYQALTRLQPRRKAPYQAGDGQPVLFCTGPQDVTPAPIPFRIWSYWHAPEPDAFVQQCIANWRLHCPDAEVHVLHSQNLQDYVASADLPPGFAQLNPVKQSDWLRLFLVSRYGGYWLDATIVLTRSLRWMDELRTTHAAEFVGFYLDGFTQGSSIPVIENWAFGAAAGTPFITAWQREFHHALCEVGTQAYLDHLRKQPEAAEWLQNIPDPVYLLGHVTAQMVLRRDSGLRLAVLKAEDTAFFYQKALGWKWYLLYPRLCLVPAEPHPAPLIKLRGGERRHFSALLAQHGGARPGSIWQCACHGVNNDQGPDRTAT